MNSKRKSENSHRQIGGTVSKRDMVDIDSKIINFRKIYRERGSWGLDREGMVCQKKRDAWRLVKEGI